MSDFFKEVKGLFIVIPVHNRKSMTYGCLECLSRQTIKGFSVIIIDDGSTDGTSEMIKEHFPDVIVLSGDGNLWWAAATNMGVEYALKNGATHIMTLNDDTLPPADFVEKMISSAEENKGSIIGSTEFDVDSGEFVYAGERVNWLLGTNVNIDKNLNQDLGLIPVDTLHGCGVMIPARVFETIGYYDSEHFPQTVADHDFICRAVKAGFSAYTDTRVKLFVYSQKCAGKNFRSNKSLEGYKRHLTDIRGLANLRFFVTFVLKNCPKAKIIPCIIFGISRRLIGYWIH